MTYLAPCHGCPFRHGCQQRDDFKARTKGLGARQVRFACPVLDRELRPGRRIIMRARFMSPDENLWGDEVMAFWNGEVPATITAMREDYKFSSIIDQDALTAEEWAAVKERAHQPELIHRRKAATHRRIVRLLDEPDADPAFDWAEPVAASAQGDAREDG